MQYYSFELLWPEKRKCFNEFVYIRPTKRTADRSWWSMFLQRLLIVLFFWQSDKSRVGTVILCTFWNLFAYFICISQIFIKHNETMNVFINFELFIVYNTIIKQIEPQMVQQNLHVCIQTRSLYNEPSENHFLFIHIVLHK